MRLRSVLFVPGDRPERMEKALNSGADGLILDLEDSVSAEKKPYARDAVRDFVSLRHERVAVLVRINPLYGSFANGDLDALAGLGLDAIVLPKAEGAASVSSLDQALSERDIASSILPIATETPAAMFRLGEYASVAARLAGLTWGAEDLPAAIGASTSRETDGAFTPPYELARSLTLFAAAAADVAPLETVYPNYRDLEGLAVYARRGARDGFVGMLAIHPTQIAVINQAFIPSAEDVARARAIVSAFEAAPEAGVVSLGGQMIDAPHLKQARKVLARA